MKFDYTHYAKTLGSVVRKTRITKGLTNIQAAKLLDIHESNYRSREMGRAPFSDRDIFNLIKNGLLTRDDFLEIGFISFEEKLMEIERNFKNV